jgi:osmotically-inducible protein OsmY
MNPPRLSLPLTALALLAGGTSVVVAQVEPRRATPDQRAASTSPRPEQVVLSAIRSHPLTAPYPIMATWQKGKVVLSGTVGTKQVHDTAIRLAIDAGAPFRDDLVIDTGAAHFVAQSAAAVMRAGPGGPLGTQSAASPYVYPPPLFGRLDDPFFGYVPPLLSFPPWWSRGTQTGPMREPRIAPGATAPAGSPGAQNGVPRAGAQNGVPRDGWQALQVDPVKGQVDVTVDISGQVFLRGSVVSDQAAREIEDAARSVPGVTGVFSQLDVIPRRADPDETPPPPLPMPAPAGPDGVAPARVPSSTLEPAIVPARRGSAPAALDSKDLTRRVVGSLERRPVAAELAVKVRSADGVVTLSGQVPSAYEAMIAYRAAQQTPGVREIIDHLEFTVPDEDHSNPLVQKGRPEDIEPYLASQIRRHVGDLAHIDRVQARGDLLELRGTIQNAGDRERLLAILRSIPVLHGFRLEPEFKAE